MITGLVRYDYIVSLNAARPFRIPIALVGSQDCDLDWDHKCRSEDPRAQENKRLEHVLIYTVIEATVVRAASDMNSKKWPRLKDNKDERYQFLESVPSTQDSAGRGLPEMVIDFKRYFTIPTEEVYRQLREKSSDCPGRRCRLVAPFKEHLQNRVCFYQSRVGLPLDHMSEPMAS